MLAYVKENGVESAAVIGGGLLGQELGKDMGVPSHRIEYAPLLRCRQIDDGGQRMKEAGPSYAVEALGFSEVPTAGDEFEVYADEKSARAVVGDRASDARATRLAQQMASRRVSLTAMSGQATEGELKELASRAGPDFKLTFKPFRKMLRLLERRVFAALAVRRTPPADIGFGGVP